MSTMSTTADPSSYADITIARITHYHFDWSVDFAASILTAHTTCTIAATGSASHITMDTCDIDVHGVTDNTGKTLKYQLGQQHAVHALGKPLTITFDKPLSANSTLTITIHTTTTQASAGIQFLKPEQTNGKKHPYLFTQFQAIHARSVFPCQDTCSNKATYTARITVPQPLVAVMSATPTTTSDGSDGKTRVCEFEQKVPIPAYLVALAVGALEHRDIGPRSRVYSEAGVVDAAAFEFSDTEKFLKIAEDICGPYVWGRYDLLMLPQSFPYGGMENPQTTFVTPTLLAGDKSLAGVIAHEIAHSWSGNLVGCKDWQSFWLNEGWTVFVENKIYAKLHGRQASGLSMQQGFTAMQSAVDSYGSDHPYTCLHCQLDSADPDDSFSQIPYEKGFSLLFYLENLVSVDLFAPFIKHYFDTFKYKFLDTEEFKHFFLNYFNDKVNASKLEQIDWQNWLYAPGMPAHDVSVLFDKTLVKQADDTAHRIVNEPDQSDSYPDVSKWLVDQQIVFLESLQTMQDKVMKSDDNKQQWQSIVTQLDKHYKYSATHNAELKYRFLVLAIKAGMVTKQNTELENAWADFASVCGRMKFVRGLYNFMYKAGGESRALAIDLFTKYKPTYHGITAKMVSKDLHLS